MKQDEVSATTIVSPLSRLQRLIIVRHGYYDGNDQLSKDGKQQITSLSRKLEPYIQGKTLMFSSTEDRAWQSADILSAAFNIPYEKCRFLVWGDESEFQKAALELIRARAQEAEVIIFVTHLEYTDDFPPIFTREFFGSELRNPEVEKGEALVIDCITKQWEIVGY
jgi:phosphohistidine phosphatase SixA